MSSFMGSGLNKIRNCILNWNQFINGKTSVDTLDNNIHVHDNILCISILFSQIKKEWKCKIQVACENIRFSSLFAAGDVSRGGTSATQRQKFYTDDVKSVRNPVRSLIGRPSSYIVLAIVYE